MAQLNEGYRACGYSAGNELPDHVVSYPALSGAGKPGEGRF